MATKKEMQRVLQSVNDYFDFGEKWLADIGRWPMPVPKTIEEVKQALGLLVEEKCHDPSKD